jgi:hypothetical protein
VRLALLVALCAAVTVEATSSWDLLREQETARWRGARMNAYLRVADWLDGGDPRPTALLAREPGTLRFAVQREDVALIDLEGLNWRGDPLEGCLERCLWLFLGRQVEPHRSPPFTFAPIHYFPSLDGYSGFTVMERITR